MYDKGYEEYNYDDYLTYSFAFENKTDLDSDVDRISVQMLRVGEKYSPERNKTTFCRPRGKKTMFIFHIDVPQDSTTLKKPSIRPKNSDQLGT